MKYGKAVVEQRATGLEGDWTFVGGPARGGRRGTAVAARATVAVDRQRAPTAAALRHPICFEMFRRCCDACGSQSSSHVLLQRNC